MQQFRTEHDLLGEVQVPATAAYGAQTQRAIDNFPLWGEKSFSDYPELLRNMLLVKKACALANFKAEQLDKRNSSAISITVDKLIADLPNEEFPVHAFHGGGGISFNMNINEVLANIANSDELNGKLGTYSPLHPNDHINLNQSTNDVVSTGCHLGIIERWKNVETELRKLSDEFTSLGHKHKNIQKISRTCLQDAVEISFEDFFSGYSSVISRSANRISGAVNELFSVSLGGTMVGRPEDSNPRYREEILPALCEVMDDDRYKCSANLYDSSQNLDDMVHVASQIKLLAQGLIKIGKDLRLMASGPQAGFGEIVLPAIQPGSSAFPGKINPSVPEFLIQSCFMAIGRCCAAEIALEHGELDLNVWEATVVINIIDAMATIENSVHLMRTKCVNGITVCIEKNKENINSIIPLMTRLKREKGYSFATRAYKESGGDYNKLKELFPNI